MHMHDVMLVCCGCKLHTVQPESITKTIILINHKDTKDVHSAYKSKLLRLRRQAYEFAVMLDAVVEHFLWKKRQANHLYRVSRAGLKKMRTSTGVGIKVK